MATIVLNVQKQTSEEPFYDFYNPRPPLSTEPEPQNLWSGASPLTRALSTEPVEGGDKVKENLK